MHMLTIIWRLFHLTVFDNTDFIVFIELYNIIITDNPMIKLDII